MIKKNTIYRTILIFIILTSRITLSNAVQDIKIAGGATDGTYYPVASQMCHLINKYSTNAKCQVLVTNGSIDNINLLQTGKVDFALVQSDVAVDAKYGKGFFTYKAPDQKLQRVFSLFPEVFSILVKDEKRIHNFDDLSGYKIGINLSGSGAKNGLLALFRYFKFKINPELIHTNDSQLAEKICDNTLDAVILFKGNPNDIAKQITTKCDVEFLNINNMELEHLLVEHPIYEKFVIPSKSYNRIAHSAGTFAARALLITNSDVDKLKITTISDIINKYFDEFKNSHPLLSTLDKKSLKSDKNL